MLIIKVKIGDCNQNIISMNWEMNVYWLRRSINKSSKLIYVKSIQSNIIKKNKIKGKLSITENLSNWY